MANMAASMAEAAGEDWPRRRGVQRAGFLRAVFTTAGLGFDNPSAQARTASPSSAGVAQALASRKPRPPMSGSNRKPFFSGLMVARGGAGSSSPPPPKSELMDIRVLQGGIALAQQCGETPQHVNYKMRAFPT